MKLTMFFAITLGVVYLVAGGLRAEEDGAALAALLASTDKCEADAMSILKGSEAYRALQEFLDSARVAEKAADKKVVNAAMVSRMEGAELNFSPSVALTINPKGLLSPLPVRVTRLKTVSERQGRLTIYLSRDDQSILTLTGGDPALLARLTACH